MARIRTIKPQFFLNEEIAALHPLDRILFIGLWTLADREGRLEDRPNKIKVQILPYDEIDIDAALSKLHEKKFIFRYEAKSERFIQIVNFLKHQQPHYKEVESEIPSPKGHKDSSYITFGVSKEQRERIMERDGHKCVNCGSEKRLSIDHITPRSAGGSGDDDNLQVLCVSCNSSKNNKLAKESSSQRRVNVGSTSGQSYFQEGKGREQEGNGIQEQEQGGGQAAFIAPGWIPKDVWDGFEEMRKKIRKPMTDRARKNIIGKLLAFRSAGHDPTAILEKSITNSWQDVYEPKPEGGNGKNFNHQPISDRKAEHNEQVRKHARVLLGIPGGSSKVPDGFSGNSLDRRQTPDVLEGSFTIPKVETPKAR